MCYARFSTIMKMGGYIIDSSWLEPQDDFPFIKWVIRQPPSSEEHLASN
jgi:hypothetical protein